ncbi:hypothetical protein IFM58399_00999 [Aspergillus lentulus]|uniref:Uncharacterized protein n=1 Tax=Aspergillus lentulus TaxID=293939 RepID=A0AAN5YVM7_ASPLE|nr:uncharacterized protein IFM58399_00999 [Aspergillus lentulus]KAF4159375.1 hypothetical protein CNMCM6069_002042 [Aspergillus lentulus]KAF4168648.1 hypothetical protein CNMCM6936_001523 [Aspergillus lentulus]KAF4173494.1 hypothetical protein CNMCM8060_000072 [Aspergillus lentulus]KAF4188223.1 hypothetical protein CNMCM7927_002320 [Aspergillus lentulus]KAF4195439.1 hypothetical protein CNMCM8694_006365 [Aspergillus lentulus]
MENGLLRTCSRGADLPVPMQSNIASPYTARCGPVPHRSFSSAGRNIVLWTVDTPNRNRPKSQGASDLTMLYL